MPFWTLSTRRVKQGRLSFEPLTAKPTISSSPAASISCKRKLNIVPDLQTSSRQCRQDEHRVGSGNLSNFGRDNEVSSSSEADGINLAKIRRQSSVSLDKFVQREDTITSTNEIIDLTDSLDVDVAFDYEEMKMIGTACESDASDLNSQISGFLFGPSFSNGNEHSTDKLMSDLETEHAHHDTDKLMSDLETEHAHRDTDKLMSDLETEHAHRDTDKLMSDLETEHAHHDTDKLMSDLETEHAHCDTEGVAQGQLSLSDESKFKFSPIELNCENSITKPHEKSGASVDAHPANVSESHSINCGDAIIQDVIDPVDESKSTQQSVVVVLMPDRRDVCLSESHPSSTILHSTGDGVQVKQELNMKNSDYLFAKHNLDEEESMPMLPAKKCRKKNLPEIGQCIEEMAERKRAKKEEREKKEKERLMRKEQIEKDKLERFHVKEIEKKKKHDILSARLLERKKKGDEKRQKDDKKKKEEEEKAREEDKRKSAFTCFFSKSKMVSSTKVEKQAEVRFIPFEVKRDMVLAPLGRCTLAPEQKQHLDDALSTTGHERHFTSYLDDLRERVRAKCLCRTGRILRTKKEVDYDVQFVVHDLEAVKKVSHAVKLIQFHTDYRPQYFGTWRKKPRGLSARNPWKKDTDVFDYEVDSDEEWEEEEPGESLSDSNDEDDDGDEEEEGDDDGWMVPHGYLSDGEGCENDDELGPEVMKARQKSKAMAWEMKMKSRRAVKPPVVIGCLFDHSQGHPVPEGQSFLALFQIVCLRECPVDILPSNPGVADMSAVDLSDNNTMTPRSSRKKELPEEAMPDLIRLVHGSVFGIKTLVREFRQFWSQKAHCNNEHILNCLLLESSWIKNDQSKGNTEVRNTLSSDSLADVSFSCERQPSDGRGDPTPTDSDTGASKRQIKIKINAIAVREKRDSAKTCWYVHEHILEKYQLSDLTLENNWMFISRHVQNKTPPAPLQGRNAQNAMSESLKSGEKRLFHADSDDEETTVKLRKGTLIQASSPFLPQSKKGTAKSSPTSQRSIISFARKSKTPNLDDTVRMEYQGSVVCLQGEKSLQFSIPDPTNDDCIVLD